ncbi:MAG: RAMP superfamily CRISPR-associated protein [Ktedonobacteraceae bacterium]
MNPYDFVRIDVNKVPIRRKPIWHHQLVGQQGQRLYAGHLEIDVFTETPLFIADPHPVSADPRRAAQSLQNKQGQYIIPGSSLKGLLRCLVETLGNGCFTLFDGRYEPSYEMGRMEYKAEYDRKIPADFKHCSTNTNLCIACRIFGMLKERSDGVFLGKVNVSDATTTDDTIRKYQPMFTAPLVNPKPHHDDFYLDASKQYIAGRKYYFHHATEPVNVERFINFGRGVQANRYIQPLDKENTFSFRIDFSNLAEDEFAALLLAVTLEPNMRHKIGYAKPLGLGTIRLTPTSLTLIDYTQRYTLQAGVERGKTEYKGDTFNAFRDSLVNDFSRTQLVQVAMTDLRRIWRWPADATVKYSYPSKDDWFDVPTKSKGKRIAQTP